MKKTVKKLLSLLLICLFTVQGIPVIAAENSATSVSGGTFTVGSVTGSIGDTVSVDVVITDNPGINAMSLEPVYDKSLLQLDAVKAGKGIWAKGEDEIASKYVWANMAGDIYEGGVVVSFKFTILDASSIVDVTSIVNTTVSLIYDGSNKAEITPPMTVVDGTVTIVPNKAASLTVGSGSYISGDIIEIPVVLKNNPGICAMVLEPVYDSSVLELVWINPENGIWSTAQCAYRYVWLNMSGDITDNGTVITLVFKVLDTAPHGETTVSVLYDGSNKDEETPVITPISGVSTIHNAADIITEAAVEPTCQSDGHTAGKYCSVCNEIFIKQEYLPPLEHNFETDFTIDIEPTETRSGQISRHCRNCDAATDITTIPPIAKGDINGDGTVDTKDLTRLMRYVAGFKVIAYNPDLNSDEFVNTKDISRLMKFLAGFDVEFG